MSDQNESFPPEKIDAGLQVGFGMGAGRTESGSEAASVLAMLEKRTGSRLRLDLASEGDDHEPVLKVDLERV